jgi:hypothetical protein
LNFFGQARHITRLHQGSGVGLQSAAGQEAEPWTLGTHGRKDCKRRIEPHPKQLWHNFQVLEQGCPIQHVGYFVIIHMNVVQD